MLFTKYEYFDDMTDEEFNEYCDECAFLIAILIYFDEKEYGILNTNKDYDDSLLLTNEAVLNNIETLKQMYSSVNNPIKAMVYRAIKTMKNIDKQFSFLDKEPNID